MVSKWVGYNPFTNHLLTSWDIQIAHMRPIDSIRDLRIPNVGSVRFTTFGTRFHSLTMPKKGTKTRRIVRSLTLIVSGL